MNSAARDEPSLMQPPTLRESSTGREDREHSRPSLFGDAQAALATAPLA